MSGTPPAFDDPHPLPPGTAEGFRERGHAVVRGLASAAELEPFRRVIVPLAREHCWDKRPLAERETYGKAFLQAGNLWERDETVRRFVFSRRFARAAAELMGVPAVRLYHDQALLKEPGGGPTPWHQDQFYWPFDTPHTVTMWMPLVDVPPEVGSMTFASGSHRAESLGEFAIGDESESAFGAIAAERGLPLETHGPLRAGDATFHAGWTLHRAGPNPTQRMREVMTVIYYADGARVARTDHPARAFDLRVWLRGLGEGDLAATDRNPVLYREGA